MKNKKKSNLRAIKRYHTMMSGSVAASPLKGSVNGMTMRRRRRRTASEGKTSYYAFAATTQMGFWRFLHFRDSTDSIYTSSQMTQRFERVNDEMGEVWRRIAVDQAMSLDDASIEPTSLRLYKVTVNVEDVSAEMFDDRGMYEQHKKMAAIGRISDEEARILGIEKQRAMYKLSTDPDGQPDDLRRVKVLGKAGIECEGDSVFNALD